MTDDAVEEALKEYNYGTSPLMVIREVSVSIIGEQS